MAPEEELSRAADIATTEQALAAPIQDPQLCVLPSGRYVVHATPTTTPNVYNVTFHNNGVNGTWPGNSCKTMKLVWDEGIPYPALPPQPPAQADFHKRLLEGWWQESNADKRFAVKAVWGTDDNLGVITQIGGVTASGYFVVPRDLGPNAGWRFNYAGGTSTDRTQLYPYMEIFESYRKVVITDSVAKHSYQRLSCLSGTTRLATGSAYNCPLPW